MNEDDTVELMLKASEDRNEFLSNYRIEEKEHGEDLLLVLENLKDARKELQKEKEETFSLKHIAETTDYDEAENLNYLLFAEDYSLASTKSVLLDVIWSKSWKELEKAWEESCWTEEEKWKAVSTLVLAAVDAPAHCARVLERETLLKEKLEETKTVCKNTMQQIQDNETTKSEGLEVIVETIEKIMNHITAGELKTFLENVPNKAVVVISFDDERLLYPINAPVVKEGHGVIVGTNSGAASLYHAIKEGEDVKSSTFPLLVL